MNENKEPAQTPVEKEPENEAIETVEVTIVEDPQTGMIEGESVDHSQTLAEIDQLDQAIAKDMELYKASLWAVGILVGLYLLCLFVFKTGVLIVCILMIIAAVMNTRYSRRVQKAAAKRAKLKKSLENPQPAQSTADGNGLEIGTDRSDEAIVTDVKSLNELPKEYTVLDHVKLGDTDVENIVVSPYGIAVVGEESVRPQIEAILAEANADSPIFFYSADLPVNDLAGKIQMEKIVVLSEQQIMSVLQKLLGLR